MPVYPRATGLGGTPLPSGGGNFSPGSTPGSPRRPAQTPNRNDLTGAIGNQPLPYDATAVINQIRKQYEDQMAYNQTAFDRMLAQQQQYNNLFDPNAGLAEHQRLLELMQQQQQMLQLQRPQNTMALLHGY